MGRAIASLIVVLIGSLTTPCTCFTWTAGPPPNGRLLECLGNNVSLDWDFLTSTEDTILSVLWYFTNATHTDPKNVATASSSIFVQLSNNKTRVEFLPKAGLRLYNLSTHDLGTYTVNINLYHLWNVINKQRSVTLALPDTPVLSSGRMRAWVVSGTVTVRGSSHLRLACGTINNHQHANFSVTWTTPSGRSLPSSSYADGVFYLTLDNPVAGGPYSCQLQGITALSCLRNGSQATMAVVDVDALGARMLVLEDSARRHDRDLELQERVADVVSQSINNITVNLQVVDELTEETSQRVDSLCTHVQVIDNVTTETAQRMDKVMRNVEDQREAQSRMKESLIGVIEELTNQSGRVTNLALSVDFLKSDTEKLSGSVDSLTTDTKTLSGSVVSLTTDIKTLSGSVDSLTTDMRTLSGSVDSFTTDTNKLSGSVDSLKFDTKTLNRSLDRLTSDTKTLNRSLGSLTSELRATVDVQRKQTSQGEEQHADVVLLLQKTNNLTALAERQQAELIQQKQTITSLMAKLTSVVDILGISSKLYKNFASSCQVVKAVLPSSGVRTLLVETSVIPVYCDQTRDGGGWTVIQRRVDGSVNFNRNWSEYEAGFGNLETEFWLGLSNMHRLTTARSYRLRVDLSDFRGNVAYAVYDIFYIDGPYKNYTLHIGGYSGTARDAFGSHDGYQFTTPDRENDVDPKRHCGISSSAGWWFNNCIQAGLNGPYSNAQDTDAWFGWKRWFNDWRALKTADMKIRPKN